MFPDSEVVESNYKMERPEADTSAAPTTATTPQQQANQLSPPPPQKRKRGMQLFEPIPEPLSPSSSSASQATSADATFEPTIDMMVNDFDDEQTLNEEEALAATELMDPRDEIATLQEEGEMPLEELLAKYSALPPMEIGLERSHAPSRKKARKASSGAEADGVKRKKLKNMQREAMSSCHHDNDATTEAVPTAAAERSAEQPTFASSADEASLTNGQSDVIVIESGDDDDEVCEEVMTEGDSSHAGDARKKEAENNGDQEQDAVDATPRMRPVEKAKLRRSHLLDLYPEQVFAVAATADVGDGEKVLALEDLYGDDEEDDDEEAEGEEPETDPDYVKKTIMVGSAFQAVIPDGMSQYGDVLPYENEDKLIWEPSQVSEREVEEYLLKARDIKPTLSAEEDAASGDEALLATGGKGAPAADQSAAENEEMEQNLSSSKEKKVISSTAGGSGPNEEASGVVKDNEQALHLLVQCGYDFKEALRRKRLNAVPLTGSMSLWSEEECHKFEEGIQKFGKDFLKIRQNQVRTRTMRELVQFYYLWKKSERRDHDFANADTVDHMDMYLNEGGDYGSNAAAAAAVAAAAHTPGQVPIAGAASNTRKTVPGCNQKNFSIMTGGSAGCSTLTSTVSPQIHATVCNSNTTSNVKTTPGRRRAVGTAPGVTLVGEPPSTTTSARMSPTK